VQVVDDVVGLVVGGSVGSLQPPKKPGEVQVVEEVGGEVVTGSVGSLHPPKNPGDVHVVDVVVAVEVGDVGVGVGTAVKEGVARVVVDVGSLQPNQPGVLHVVVVAVVLVLVLVAVPVSVVVSSRHPHHPGVLHVSVLVRVFVDDGFDFVVVVVSELLLS
jgi:hypothetical protein